MSETKKYVPWTRPEEALLRSVAATSVRTTSRMRWASFIGAKVMPRHRTGDSVLSHLYVLGLRPPPMTGKIARVMVNPRKSKITRDRLLAAAAVVGTQWSRELWYMKVATLCACGIMTVARRCVAEKIEPAIATDACPCCGRYAFGAFI